MGRFYQTSKATPIDFAYRAPLELMMQATTKKSEQKQAVDDQLANLHELIDTSAIKVDVEQRNAEVARVEEEIEDLASKFSQDPLKYLRDMEKIRGLSRRVNKNLKRGKLHAIQSRYNTEQSMIERHRKLMEKDPEKFKSQYGEKFMQYIQNNQEEIKYDETSGGYNRYNDDTLNPYVDLYEQIDKRGANWESYMTSNWGWNVEKSGPNGGYIVTRGSTREVVPEAELQVAFEDFLMNDPAIKTMFNQYIKADLISQQERLDLLQSVTNYGVTKFRKDHQKKTGNVKVDGNLKAAAAYRRKNPDVYTPTDRNQGNVAYGDNTEMGNSWEEIKLNLDNKGKAIVDKYDRTIFSNVYGELEKEADNAAREQLGLPLIGSKEDLVYNTEIGYATLGNPMDNLDPSQKVLYEQAKKLKLIELEVQFKNRIKNAIDFGEYDQLENYLVNEYQVLEPSEFQSFVSESTEHRLRKQNFYRRDRMLSDEIEDQYQAGKFNLAPGDYDNLSASQQRKLIESKKKEIYSDSDMQNYTFDLNETTDVTNGNYDLGNENQRIFNEWSNSIGLLDFMQNGFTMLNTDGTAIQDGTLNALTEAGAFENEFSKSIITSGEDKGKTKYTGIVNGVKVEVVEDNSGEMFRTFTPVPGINDYDMKWSRRMKIKTYDEKGNVNERVVTAVVPERDVPVNQLPRDIVKEIDKQGNTYRSFAEHVSRKAISENRFLVDNKVVSGDHNNNYTVIPETNGTMALSRNSNGRVTYYIVKDGEPDFGNPISENRGKVLLERIGEQKYSR